MSDAAGRWELPGGHIDAGEGVLEAARREFAEEVGVELPPTAKLSGEWISGDGVYHGFLFVVEHESDIAINLSAGDRLVSNPDGDTFEATAWWSPDDAEGNPVLRREVLESTPWDDLRDVARARHAAARLAAVQASGEWHNSDGWSRDVDAETFAQHLMLDHPYLPTERDHLPSEADELDQLHQEDHSVYGEVGAHDAEEAEAEARHAAIAEPLEIIREIPGQRRRKRDPLEKVNRKLQTIDADLRRQLKAGAEVAMADGLRRAGVKVTQRAGKRSKAVQASVGGCDGVYPPAVLAAAGITEQEALAHAFDAYADRAARWIDEAHRKRERILREELGADASLLARARQRWQQATARAVGVLTAGLTDLAIARLTKGHPHEPEGETGSGPAPLVPGSLILQAVDAADGKDGRWAPGVTFEVIGESGIHVGVITDGRPLVERIVWRWNDSEVPFPPHLDLDGTEATGDTYQQVWAKSPDEFPYNTAYWFPGDHHSCGCSWDTEWVAGDPTTPEAVAASAGTIDTDT